jgi:hypothetical protein
MRGPDKPRRYISRSGGHVLIGLTPEETLEFEHIDALAALAGSGKNDDQAVDEAPASTGERRWLELYQKHENAWVSWKAHHRAGSGTTEQSQRPASH